jgi:hypothetical protein
VGLRYERGRLRPPSFFFRKPWPTPTRRSSRWLPRSDYWPLVFNSSA